MPTSSTLPLSGASAFTLGAQQSPIGPSDKEGADESLRQATQVQQFIQHSRRQAENSRRERLLRNRENREAFLNQQDWSHKLEGQSREFIPKTAVATEQMCSLIKRGLTSFGSWFDLEMPEEARQLMPMDRAAKFLAHHLENLHTSFRDENRTPFDVKLTDAVRLGILESLIILKVGGHLVSKKDGKVWVPTIDVIPFEDYYVDPTGRCLWEIHRTQMDLYKVQDLARGGVFNSEEVEKLVGTHYTKERTEKRLDHDRAQLEVPETGSRKTVVLEEFWGTILDEDGTVLHRNRHVTLANDKYVLRNQPNPFWHQGSPFVCAPLLRVPFSATHKALADQGVRLNRAINELVSLMIDGGIASVWGTRQLRMDHLEDPSQVAGGIRQGSTLAVTSTLPVGAKVLEQLTEGEIPRDAPALLALLEREFAQAMLTTESNMAAIPKGDVLATEIVEAQQGAAGTLDGIVKDLERLVIRPVLSKTWSNLMQHYPKLDAAETVDQLGIPAALGLARLPRKERMAIFSPRRVRVYGLSESLSRTRDFQKMVAFLQATASNPWLFQAVVQRLSADKAIRTMVQQLNIDFDSLALNPEEMEMLPEIIAQTVAAQQLLAAGGGQQRAGLAGASGDSRGPAEINQLSNPLTGLNPQG